MPATVISAVSTLLLQSPPNEVNDVLQDLRTIVANDDLLHGADGIRPALRSYNLDQFTVVKLDSGSVLLTSDSISAGDRYVDPESKRSFEVDQITMLPSNYKPIAVDEGTEEIRSPLAKALATMVANHYNDGVAAVFSLPDPNYPTAVEHIVEPENVGILAQIEEVEALVEEGGLEERGEQEKTEEIETEKIVVDQNEVTHEHAEVSTLEVIGEDMPMDGAAALVQDEQVETRDEDKLQDETTQVEDIKETVDELVVEGAEAAVIMDQLPGPITSRLFSLYLVGNKYNPSNFWSGRWRSKYTVDFETGVVKGEIQIRVHYWENGNVQLSTTLSTTTSLPLPLTTISVIASIKLSESKSHSSLASEYTKLSEESLRNLRRALPITRNKLNWESVGNYMIGKKVGSSAM